MSDADGVTTITLRIRQFMRTHIEATIGAEGSASLPVLATEARVHFLNDADCIKQIGEMIEKIAYQQGTQLFSSSRSTGGAKLFGDAVMDAATAEEAAEQGIAQSKPLSKWATWVEHAGKRYVPLLQMVDTELRAAAEMRFKRSDTEREVGVLWLALADKLEGGQTVGDRFTAEQIEELRKEIKGKQQKRMLDAARPGGR